MSAIALRHLGDASLWPRIETANPQVSYGTLRVGDTLVLPTPASELEQAFVLELGWEQKDRQRQERQRRQPAGDGGHLLEPPPLGRELPDERRVDGPRRLE